MVLITAHFSNQAVAAAPAEVAEGDQLLPVRGDDKACIQHGAPSHAAPSQRARATQLMTGKLSPSTAVEPGEDGDAAIGRDQQAGAEAACVKPPQAARPAR